ncbi:rep protein, partial [Escherichia coli]
AFQEVRRADTPSQGLSGRQEPRQPPAKPICTVQAATRLVGGRRPSVLQRWGVVGSPDGFRLRSRRCRTVAARSFWRSGSKNTQGILRRQKSNAG